MKINVCHDMKMLECAHKRHFYEGLARCGQAEVSFDVGAPGPFDVTFDTSRDKAGAKKIALMTYDPHGLPHDFDPTDLVDARFWGMLHPSRQGILRHCFQTLQRSTAPGHRSIVDCIVEQKYDVLAMNLDWPFRSRLRPKMPTGFSYMRIGPRVPEWIFYPDWSRSKRLDCFHLGSLDPDFYPLRARIAAWLPASQLKYEVHPAKPPADPVWASVAAFDQHQHWYAGKLRESKIAPFCGSIFNICVGRYLEAMACGCLVLAPVPHDADLFGFRAGYNMVEIGPNDFADKIRYYADDAHAREREEIARRGTELVLRRHTATTQAVQVVEKLRQYLGGRSMDEIERDHDVAARLEWSKQVTE